MDRTVYNVTLRHVRVTTVAVEKQWVLHNASECVCSHSCPASKAHAPYCHLSPAPLYVILPHYLINSTSLEKKLLKIKRVFRVSLQHLSETLINLRRNEKDMIKNVYRSSYKVPAFLSQFNETWIFSIGFRKYSNTEFHENPSIGSRVVPCGRQKDGRIWRS